jgi:hypothetical protein
VLVAHTPDGVDTSLSLSVSGIFNSSRKGQSVFSLSHMAHSARARRATRSNFGAFTMSNEPAQSPSFKLLMAGMAPTKAKSAGDVERLTAELASVKSELNREKEDHSRTIDSKKKAEADLAEANSAVENLRLAWFEHSKACPVDVTTTLRFTHVHTDLN